MQYDMDARLFIPWGSTASDKPHNPLPVLSLAIIDKDTLETLYDLTDYIEKMRYVNGIVPAIGHIISAWQLYSNIVVDAERCRVNYLDNEGGEHIAEIRSVKNLA